MYDAGSVVGRIVLNTRGWDTGYSNVIGGLRNLARAATFYGAAAAVGIYKMTSEFGRFELEMRRATSVFDVTEAEFTAMSKAAEDASIKWNVAAVDAAKGFLYMGRAGLTAAQQMEAFEPILLASKSMMTDLGTTSEGIINTMNAFHIGFSRTAEVVNIVSAAVNKSTQNLDDMLIALSYSAKPAQMMNNTLAELSSMLALVANEGIRGSKAGTALRFALTALASPVADARQLMRDLGLQMYNSSGRAIPLVDVLDQLKIRLIGATEETRNFALETLFGRRALPTMIALFQLGGSRIRAFEHELQTTGDTAEAVATRQLKAFLEQLGRMYRAFQSLVRHIASAVIPTFTRWGNTIRDHLEYWRNWVDAHQAAVEHVVTMTFKIGALTVAFGALALILPSVIGALKTIGSLAVFALTPIYNLFTKAGRLALFTFLKSPVTWVLTAVAAVLTGLYIVRAAWNASLFGMNKTHISFGKAVSDWLNSYGNHCKVIFDYVRGDWNKNWESMDTAARKTLDSILDATVQFGNEMKDALLGIVKRPFVGAFNTMKDSWAQHLGFLRSQMTKNWEFAKKMAKLPAEALLTSNIMTYRFIVKTPPDPFQNYAKFLKDKWVEALSEYNPFALSAKTWKQSGKTLRDTFLWSMEPWAKDFRKVSEDMLWSYHDYLYIPLMSMSKTLGPAISTTFQSEVAKTKSFVADISKFAVDTTDDWGKLPDAVFTNLKSDLGKLGTILADWATKLAEWGWDKAFGWLLKPMPAESIGEWLRNWKPPEPRYPELIPTMKEDKSRIFTQRWREMMKDTVTNFTSIATGLQTAMDSIVNAWTDAFDRLMAKGGSIKTFFDDIFQSMLASLRHFLAQAAAQSLITAIFGTGGVGEKEMGMKLMLTSIWDTFKGWTGHVSVPLPVSPYIPTMPAGRQHGGPVESGRAYIVGERRPELFIPKVPGTVFPKVPSLSSSQIPQVTLNILNKGEPLRLRRTGSTSNGRELVINFVVDEVQRNPQFRDLLRGA